MTVKQRGRPLGPKGKQRKFLSHPPKHIAARIAARKGSLSHRWVEVLVDMDSHAALIEKLRKRHRLTHQAVEILLRHPEEEIPDKKMEDVLLAAPSWKKTGSLGGSKATKKRREWEEVVDKTFMATLMRHKAARAASLILKNWPVERCPKPCDRSLRGYIGQQKKILASSFG